MAIRRLGALAALTLLIAACSPGPGTGGQLEGTRWVLDAYDQGGTLTILPDGLYADADFSGQRVSGFSGCNQYSAVYRTGARTLFVSQLAGTFMACDETAMTFEQTYQTLLESSRFFSVHRDTLTIFDSIGSVALVFNAAPRNPLLGKWLVDSYGTTPGTVVAVLPGTSIDVVFGIGNVGGFAGCNSFTGAYGTNGSIVRVGRLATTRMACDQDVTDQESAFLAALEGAAFIEPRGTTLNLTDRSGNIVVALARPVFDEGAAASPSPSPKPSATEEPSPSPSPTEKPTEKPTAKPTAKPTEKPTAPPTPTATPVASLPIELPPTASCSLAVVGGPVVADIVYPGTWYSVASPPDLACRYFDPEPITVPSDPTTLETPVMADVTTTAFQDAVAAATDPGSWSVLVTQSFTVRGVDVTCVGAVSTADSAGIPVGDAAFSCLADVGTAGTVVIWTTGSTDDAAFEADAAVVGFMTTSSTFTPPG